MSLSLMWRVMLFTWINVFVFIVLCRTVLEVLAKPYGFKEATLLKKDKTKNIPKQREVNPLNGVTMEDINEFSVDLSNSKNKDVYVEDGFLPNFNKRIDDLRHELDDTDIPEDLKDSFYVYPEDEEYKPDLHEPVSGVEIITDAYERRMDERLK